MAVDIAGVYLAWDANSVYCLMGDGDSELQNSGTTRLCMWEAIKFSDTVTLKIDFGGSMLESVERFFRAFGAQQTLYFQVRRTTSRIYRTAEFMRSSFRVS